MNHSEQSWLGSSHPELCTEKKGGKKIDNSKTAIHYFQSSWLAGWHHLLSPLFLPILPLHFLWARQPGVHRCHVFPASWGQCKFLLMEVRTPQINGAFNLCHLIPVWHTIWVATLKVGQIQIALFSKQQRAFSFGKMTKSIHTCVINPETACNRSH